MNVACYVYQVTASTKQKHTLPCWGVCGGSVSAATLVHPSHPRVCNMFGSGMILGRS